MGLIELCLLSLLSPQAPDATATPPVEVAEPAAASQDPAAAAAATPDGTTGDTPTDPAAAAATSQAKSADDGARKRLLAAEKAGHRVDGKELLNLAGCSDAAVAVRAAWLLARSKNPDHRVLLPTLVESSQHADARLQAMQGLLRGRDQGALQTALTALTDEDRRVRTVAVQLLGQKRKPATIEPLLALIDTVVTVEAEGPATDVQAALLTLTDLGATKYLLRMATAIHDGKVEATGTALAYAFQTLTPSMNASDETTLLVAVLGHNEGLLRRYAITRLAELGSPTAAGALEGRLAVEGPELRPLLEVALSQIRHDHAEPPTDEVERAKANAKAIWVEMKTKWNALEPLHQGLVAGIPVLLLMMVVLVRRRSRRRRNQEDALAVTAMVAPSDEYLEEQEEEDYDEEYDDEEGEYDEEDYDDDEEEEEEEEEDNEYDTSGWEEDEEAVHSEVGDYDDERQQ